MGASQELRTVYYHITNRCNLQCRHCWVRANELVDPELSLAQAKDVMGQAMELGLRNVKITGGEPFVVSWVMDFVGFLRGHGIDVAFETNGTLITEDIAVELARMQVDTLAISLDGSTAGIHESVRRVPGCFEAATAGIRHLTSAGIRPGVLMAVDRTNIDDVPQLVSLARSLNAKYVKLNVIQAAGRGADMLKGGTLLSLEEQFGLFDSVADLQKQTQGTDVQMSFPPLLVSASGMRHRMCAKCDVRITLGLLADGRIAMCGIGNINHALVYGSVRQTPLRTIWESQENPHLVAARNLKADALTGVCARCMFKEVCLGGCRGLAFERFGSVTAPWPLCQDAFEAGHVRPARLSPVTTG